MIIDKMDYTFHDYEFSIEKLEIGDDGLIFSEAFLILDNRKLAVPLTTFMTSAEFDEFERTVLIECVKLKKEDDIYQAGEREKSRLWEAAQ